MNNSYSWRPTMADRLHLCWRPVEVSSRWVGRCLRTNRAPIRPEVAPRLRATRHPFYVITANWLQPVQLPSRLAPRRPAPRVLLRQTVQQVANWIRPGLPLLLRAISNRTGRRRCMASRTSCIRWLKTCTPLRDGNRPATYHFHRWPALRLHRLYHNSSSPCPFLQLARPVRWRSQFKYIILPAALIRLSFSVPGHHFPSRRPRNSELCLDQSRPNRGRHYYDERFHLIDFIRVPLKRTWEFHLCAIPRAVAPRQQPVPAAVVVPTVTMAADCPKWRW